MEARENPKELDARANHQSRRKETIKDCKNWRGITLLSVVGKTLFRIIINRIRIGVDRRLRKEQAGYRKGKGTAE